MFLRYLALAAFSGLAIAAPEKIPTRRLELKPQYHNGTVSVEHLSVAGNLDGFKMQTPAARKSADFWYFDVFSSATNQTLNIVFFNTGEFAQYPHPLAVQVSGVFSNGTDFYYEALADDGVSISNGPRGIRGDWRGIGSFKGSSFDKPDIEYSIRLDSLEMGISGNIKFKATAPPHYPCDLNGAIKDTKIRFKDGIGYHDKNWGNQSIIDGRRYWDWGHGRFGPYSIVWYNLLDYVGNESRRSYVLTVRYTLPDGQELFVDVTTEIIVRDESGAYQRANGIIKGGIKGQETYEGKGHYEEFIFGIVNDHTPNP